MCDCMALATGMDVGPSSRPHTSARTAAVTTPRPGSKASANGNAAALATLRAELDAERREKTELVNENERLSGERAPLRTVRETVLSLRRSKGMVLDPSDPDTVSAGSFFTNPILSASDYRRLRDRLGEDVPCFAEPDGRVKVPAAWL